MPHPSKHGCNAEELDLHASAIDEQFCPSDVRNDNLVSESNSHLATALAGLGIVHTLDFMVRPFIEQKRRAPILAQWRPEQLEIYIAYPPSRRYSTKVRVLADWAGVCLSHSR
jgi:DNA-binding transcriptional LysR family regulator